MPWSQKRNRFYPTLLDEPWKFWAKVDERGKEECWPWQGTCDTKGYGRAGKSERAHRVAFMLARGPIPTGMLIRHRCDNPPCCNPFHLELGTKADNAQDAVERRRHYSPFSAAERARHGAPTGGAFVRGDA